MLKLTFFLLILNLATHFCDSYQFNVSDNYDHMLVISTEDPRFSTVRGLNRSTIDYSKYKKVINWSGVYDMVDFGSSVEFTNGTIKSCNNSRSTRDEKAAGIVRLIDPDYSAFRGVGNESVTYKFFDHGSSYNNDNYHIIHWSDKIQSYLKSVRKFYETYVSLLINSISDFISMSFPIASDMLSKSAKKECGSSTQWYRTYNSAGTQVTYLVAISKWTTGKNCDTQATNETIVDGLEEMLQQADNEHLASWCSSFNNGETWKTDVRFLLCLETHFSGQSIWDIPCAD